MTSHQPAEANTMATTLESAARILCRRRNTDKRSRIMLRATLAKIRSLREVQE